MAAKKLIAASALILSIGLITTGCATAVPVVDTPSPEASVSESATPETSTTPTEDTDSATESNEPAEESTKMNSEAQTVAQLEYLIEEEKLAHDVYQAMFDLWGARVFGNILQSESTHQSQVLTLLEARDIEDPRSSQVGVFNNTELQNLYDDLIEKGSISARDAFEVGVMIEELDIKDISIQLALTSEADVILTLERLRSASESHLRAFNNQL
jgi:hypothetical protein